MRRLGQRRSGVRTDPLQQAPRTERLGHDFGNAKGFDFAQLRVLSCCREDDAGQVAPSGVVAQDSQNLRARHHRQHQIEQHQRDRWGRLEMGQRFCAMLSKQHPDPGLFEPRPDDAADMRLIVHHEHNHLGG